jgi:hypothetical protein
VATKKPSEDPDTDQFIKEEVERRRAPRGLFPGLTVRLLDGGAARTLDVIEASRKSLFLAADNPAAYTLNLPHEAEIAFKSRSVRCKVEVVRAETSPRRGIAVVVKEITPEADRALHEVLADAEVIPD